MNKKPEQMTRQEVSDAVGLEKIEDANKREAIAQRLYERRQELISEKAAARRGLLTEKVAQIDKSKKDVNEVLDEIVAELQLARIEEDRFGDFEVGDHGIDGKADNLFKGGYAGWYHDRMVEYGISAEADTKEYALNTFVIPAITAVPSIVKRQYRNLYAVQAIDAFVKAMDEYEGFASGNVFAKVTKQEIRDKLKMQNFDDWLKANPYLKQQDIYLQYDKIDQAALAASEGVLKTIEEKLKNNSISEDEKVNFQQRLDIIRKTQVENPQKAREDAEILLRDIEALLVPAAAVETQEDAEEGGATEAAQGQDAEEAPQATPQEGAEAPAAAPEEGADAAPGETKKVDFLEDPIGYLKNEHKFIYGVIAFLGLEEFVRGMFSKGKGKGGELGSKIESFFGNMFLSKKMKLGKNILEDKLEFSEKESKALLSLKVGEVIKAGAPPPDTGIDKDKFAFLQESLKLNGADEKTEDALGDFIGDRHKEWKLPEKTGEDIAQASEAEAPAVAEAAEKEGEKVAESPPAEESGNG